MKKIIFIILIFGTGFSVPFILRLVKIANNPKSEFKPQILRYNPSPPTMSVSGSVTDLSGIVEKSNRNSTQSSQIRTGARILQGESITTGPNSSATINYPITGKFMIKSTTEAVFVNTIRESFLIWLKNGQLSYLLKKESLPISVRASGILIQVSGGSGDIDNQAEESILRVRNVSGLVKIGFEDSDNQTRIRILNPGQSATINTSQKSLDIN